MPRIRDYQDYVSHKKRSVLPPKLQRDIVELSEAIRNDGDISTPLSSYVSGMKALPPASIVRATSEIRTAADLMDSRFRESVPGIGVLVRVRRWVSRRKVFPIRSQELRALERHPALCFFFIFHGDGRLREAALKTWNEIPDSPFIFVALTYRLNDWVKQVRAAAYECAARLFPRTPADVIAEASFFLLPQIQYLERWGKRERRIVLSTLHSQIVMSALARRLMQRTPGRVSAVLRQALIRPGLDNALPSLANDAALPQVRAIALETLVMRRARWLTGYQYEWVDKHYGIRRRVPRFDQRPIEHQLNVEDLLVRASRDRSADVRKITAQCLIDLRLSLSPDMIAVAKSISKDKAQAVRSRAEYYLQHV